MKQLSILLLMVLPMAIMAQEIKPSLPKAEKALREGKVDEAKKIIDATTSNKEFMEAKKGGPSKNAASAWFLRGIIYAAIDTSKNEAINQLDPNAFTTVKESFEKAKELDPKAGSFIKDVVGLPIPNDQIYNVLAQTYFNQAIEEYQENKDYKKALDLTEEVMYFIPDDTSVLLNAGVYFAPAAEENDKAVEYMRRYIDKGGNSQDPYVMLFGIYRDKEQNLDKALAIAQEAQKKFPNNPDFPRYELDIYIKTNKLPEARTATEKQALANPNDKESRYYLGIINFELKDYVAAKKWYEEAVKLDPKYFEPNLGLAEVSYVKAKALKVQMNQLGITPADKKKKLELDKEYVAALKEAEPYYENAEKLSPNDERVLDNLHMIYLDLGEDSKITALEKKMKILGLLD